MPGHVHRYTLENLLPGNYDIYMQARTTAGTGPAGNLANVHIGEDGTHTQCKVKFHKSYVSVFLTPFCVCEGYEELSIVISVIIPLMLTSLALILIACVAQMKM